MSALAALDYLTNVNNHRRVLLTSLQGAAPSVNFEFLHFPVTFETRDGDKVVEATNSRIYVAIDEGVTKPREICLILNTLARTLAEEVFPLFEEFFK
jgi:hypothetical protein